MLPKQQVRIPNIVILLLFLFQTSIKAQCPITFTNPNQGVINQVLTTNCTATFDAAPRVNVQGNCTLVYFRNAAMTLPYNGLPTFTGANLGQTIEVFVSADDMNPATPLVTPLKFTLRIIDAVPPSITCPANQALVANGTACQATILSDLRAAASDNCNGTVALGWNLSGATTRTGSSSLQGVDINVGRTLVVYTATDASNNTATCVFTVDVNETLAPSLVNCPSDITQDAPSGTCQRIVVSGLTPSYTDNCTLASNLTLSYEMSGATEKSGNGSANNSLFNVGTTLIRYSAQDIFGNSNTGCSFNVTIRDVDRPQVICPANLTLNTLTDSCFAAVSVSNLTPLRLDNCGQNNLQTSLTLSGATVQAALPLQQVVNQRFNRGLTTVTYTVTDQAGNTNVCEQRVTILDATKPTIFCNSSHINTTTASGDCNVQVLLRQPTLSDNCSFANSLTLAYRLNGAINANGVGFVPVSQQYVPGLTTVTYRATDESGNFAECSYNVTVIEVPLVKPTLVCRGDTTVTAANGQCNRLISNGLQAISTTDNCSSLSLLRLRVSLSGATTVHDSAVTVMQGANGFIFNVGTTRVKYTLFDASGNVDSCNFNVVVRDVQRPVLQCFTDITLNANTSCSQKASQLQPSATDNCASANLRFFYRLSGATTTPTQSIPLPQVDFNVGTTTVQLYVRDAANNIDSCTFKVNVYEAIAPSISCPSNLTVHTTDSTCTALLASLPQAAQLSENCPTSIIDWTFSSTGSTILQGVSTVSNIVLNYGKTIFTYTARDFSANSAQCSFEIVVKDATLPKITCPTNITVNAIDTTCFALVSSPALTFSDNCFANLSYTIQDISGVDKSGNGVFANQNLNIGKNTVTYTVADNELNRSQCSFEILVKDVTLPSIICPPNAQLSVSTTSCTALLPTSSPITVKDNCSKQDLSYSVSGATLIAENDGIITAKSFNLGKSLVTFKVTDIGNNTATCTFEVVVTDLVRPSARCRNNVTIALDTSGNAFMPSAMFDNGSSDNCTPSNLLVFEASKEYFNCANLGDNSITLTVRDAAKNSSTCEATVKVVNSYSNLKLSVATLIEHETYWGARDGKATLQVSGGSGKFDYLWNNGFDEGIQNELAAGNYTITISDKISGCVAVQSIKIEEGPRLTISVGQIIGKVGETILVPVRVKNFNKIKQIQFSLRLANIGVGSIEGLEAIGVSSDSLKTSVIASSVNFSKVFSEANGKTLANGTLLFNIRIKLIGSIGTFSNFNFQTVLYDLRAQQWLPSGLTNIPINAQAGLVAVSNGATSAEIKGKIIREDNMPVNGVRVSLLGTYTDSVVTKNDGNYTFNLPIGTTALLQASKADEVRRGLTAIDALLLQRHILGYESFTSNYKKVAADVNKSGTLTALDVAEIKRVILGYQSSFRNIPVWQFIPANATFGAATNNQVPKYSDSLFIQYLLDNQLDKDLIAIKTGDINLSAAASFSRNDQKLGFEIIENRTASEPSNITVQIKNSSVWKEVGAIQLAIDIDKTLFDINELSSTLLNQFDASVYNIIDNTIYLAWTSPLPQSFDKGSTLFEIKLNAKKANSSILEGINLNTNTLLPIVYESNVEKELFFKAKQSTSNGSDEFSLFPNPAHHFITVNCPKGTKMKIIDAYGRVVKIVEIVDNQSIDLSELSNGSYFIHAELNGNQWVEKLVKIN
jgi:hypothetical protein